VIREVADRVTEVAGARACAHRSRSQPRPGFGGPLDRGHGHTRKAALDASGAAPARLRHGPQQPVAARGYGVRC
jgi:hypothetical protein